MRRILPLIFAAFITVPMTSRAVGVPLTLNSSGYLLDGADHPMSQVGVSLGFSIWTDVSAATQIWPTTGESACVVNVSSGFYSAVLDGNLATGCGAGLTSDHLPGTAPRYLQITVGGMSLTPRMRIGSVPTAALATHSSDTQDLIAALAQGGESVNGAGSVVDWKALKGVPADFADGADADTKYTAALGGGLSLPVNGTAFSIATGGVTNAMLERSSITLNAGTGLGTTAATLALGDAATLRLADTAVTPGTYTYATLTVDQQGRLTSASPGAAPTGTVTSVTAGAGLAGGPVTTTGTLSLASNDPSSLSKVSAGAIAASASGRVGIGTAPFSNALLAVQGGTALVQGSNPSPAQLRLIGTGTEDAIIGLSTLSNSRYIYLDESDGNKLKITGGGLTDQVTIDNNGNVGIGTTAPAEALDVVGNIKASGTITATGSNLGLAYGMFQGSGEGTTASPYNPLNRLLPMNSAVTNSGGLTLAGNKVTVSKAGFYRVSGLYSFDLRDNARTICYLYIRKNDGLGSVADHNIGSVYTYYSGAPSVDSQQDTGYISSDVILQLAANDTLSLYATDGGTPVGASYYTRLTIQQLP